jgi:hypothetical protein
MSGHCTRGMDPEIGIVLRKVIRAAGIKQDETPEGAKDGCRRNFGVSASE